MKWQGSVGGWKRSQGREPGKGASGVPGVRQGRDVESRGRQGASTCANTCITADLQMWTSARISPLQGAVRSGPKGTESPKQQRESLFMRNRGKGPQRDADSPCRLSVQSLLQAWGPVAVEGQ